MAPKSTTAMIPAEDLERAKLWYADAFGFRPSADHGEMGAEYILPGGLSAFLYPTQYAGTAKHTLLSFGTADLEADMAELRKKGVQFLDYDLPGLKTVEGVATFGTVKNAWCEDSEGNILGLVEGMSG